MRLWKRNSIATPKYKKFSSAFKSESAWTRKIPIYGVQSKKTQMRSFLRAIQRYNKYECMSSSQGVKIDKLCESDLKKLNTISQKSDLLNSFFEKDYYKTKYYLKPDKKNEFIDYLKYLKLNNDKNFDKVIKSITKPQDDNYMEVGEDHYYDKFILGDNYASPKSASPILPKITPTIIPSKLSNKSLYKSINQSSKTKKRFYQPIGSYYSRNDNHKKGLVSREPLSRYFREPIYSKSKSNSNSKSNSDNKFSYFNDN